MNHANCSGSLHVARLVDSEVSGRRFSDLDRLAFSGGISGVGSVFSPAGGSARVHKVGRTTGFTEGLVTAINASALIDFGGSGRAYFAGQMVIQPSADNIGPFSLPGDSGSAILDEHNELVGLLFAASENQTLANPIDAVLRALQRWDSPAGLEVLTA